MSKAVPRLTRATSLADAMPPEAVCRFSVDQYHRMIDADIINCDERIELLEGWLLRKPKRSAQHCALQRLLADQLEKLVDATWEVSTVRALTLLDSEPEPDLVVVSAKVDEYWDRHPVAEETALVVEFAEASLDRDIVLKQRIYARAGIPNYWVVDLQRHQIEVLTVPIGPARGPRYSRRATLSASDLLPVKLFGQSVGEVRIGDLWWSPSSKPVSPKSLKRAVER